MKFKLSLVLIIAFTLFSLFITKDMPTNNDEKLLTSGNLAIKNKIEFENLLIQYEETNEVKINNLKQQITNLINSHFEEASLISAQDLTQKDNLKEQEDFYLKFPNLKLRLNNSTSSSFIISFNADEKLKFHGFFKELLKITDQEKTYYAGLPYLNYEIGQTTVDIKTKILPILIVLSLILSFFTLKKIIPSLIFFHYPMFGIAISQFFLLIIYGESNLLSTLAPLINFVVILTLGFHLVYGAKKITNINHFITHKIKPIIFMMLTTIIGILSLSVSSIIAIKQFAFITSLSLLISSLYTILSFIYINFDYFQKHNHEIIIIPFWNLKIPRPILYATLILPFILGSFTWNKIITQTEALYFFPNDSKIVTSIKKIESTIMGPPILEIFIPNLNWQKDIKNIEPVLKLEDELSKFENIIASPAQLIRDLNYIYSGKYLLPQFSLSAMPLLSKVPAALKTNVYDEEGYTITVFHKTIDTTEYFSLIKKIESVLITYNLPYEFRGAYYNLMTSQHELINTLIQSFLISLLIVSLLVAFLFKKISDFFLFFIVNFIPSLLTYTSFYFLGLSLNMATITSFSVSFGLIVDSTIHIMYAKRNKFDETSFEQSIMIPVVLSGLILIVGFLTFVGHSFLPIWQFGLSMAMTLFFGLIYDYFILPNLEK